MQETKKVLSEYTQMSPFIKSDTKVCWDCLQAKPLRELKPYNPVPGLLVWQCGCGQSALPPFMTVAGGKVIICEDLTGDSLPDEWTGVCVSGNDAKSFWYIGHDLGERSFNKLPLEIVTIKGAVAYVENNAACKNTLAMTDAAIAVWKAVECAQAVVCESLPENLPKDWLVMNAPRPILGDQIAQGAFMHGVYYAAINPSVEFAQDLVRRNLMDDARVVFVASKVTQEAMALETISPEYQNAYRKMPDHNRANAISSFVLKLNRGKTYCEIKELARRAYVAMQEEELLKVVPTA